MEIKVKKYKNLPRILLFSVLTCLLLNVFIVPGSTNTSATGEPWLQNWSYRKGHFLSGSTDYAFYQVRIKVCYGSGTDSQNIVYCNGHCQNDFDDIRFTADDGITLLDYWRESYISSSYAYFWVEVIYISDDAGATIFMYYGNSGANYAGNIDSTFRKACDMEEGNLNDWDGSWGDTYYDTASTDHEHTGSYDMRLSYRSGGSHGYWINIYSYGQGHAYRIWFYDQPYKVSQYTASVIIEDAYGTQFYLAAHDTCNYYEYWDGAGYVSTSVLRTQGFHYYEFQVSQTNIMGVIDGQIVHTSTRLTETALNKFEAYGYRTSYYSWFDDCLVRKWADPATNHVSWGPEMTPPNGKDLTTSPYSWVLKWKYDNVNDQYIMDVTNVKFDQTAINWYHTHGWWPWFYKYTKDITELSYGGYKVSSNGYWTTNLPGPYFDRDDDNQDGHWEEAEITAFSHWSLQADYAYNSYFGFDTHSTGWTKLQHSAQISIGVLPDPQSIISDVLQNFESYISRTAGQRSCLMPSGSLSLLEWSQRTKSLDQETSEGRIVYVGSLTDQCKYTIIEKGSGRHLVNICPTLCNSTDFYQHSSWVSNHINYFAESLPVCPIQVVITFNHPVPIVNMTAFVEEHSIEVSRFKVKVLTNQGEEWTIGGEPSEAALVQQEKFNSMLRCIQADTGDSSLQVEGFTALWGTVSSSLLKTLQNNTSVLLVDVSPTLVLEEIRQLGFTGSLPYSLTDLYGIAELFQII